MSTPDTGAHVGAISVRHVPGRGRYVVAMAGTDAGCTAYVHHGSRRIFFHTGIDDRFGGRGLGGQVVGHAVADTRAAGLRIVAVCPYVARWLDRHPQFDDVRDPVTPAALAAVDQQQG